MFTIQIDSKFARLRIEKKILYYVGKIILTHCKNTKINCKFTFFSSINQIDITKKQDYNNGICIITKMF